MTSPKEFARSVRSIADPSDGIDERKQQVMFAARFLNREQRDGWMTLRAHPPGYVSHISIKHEGTDVDLLEGGSLDPNERVRIVVRKRSVDDHLCIFFADAVGAVCETESAKASHILIAEMDADEAFVTLRNSINVWVDQVHAFEPSEPLTDPRKLVKDYSGKLLVPSDIRPWILKSPPARTGAVFVSWKAAATPKLLASLFDSVALNADGEWAYFLNGPPSREISFSDIDPVEMFPSAQSAAAWVYSEGRDTDTRHLFVASELAKYIQAVDYGEALERASESAKVSYSAHTMAASRETLKALADLRKAVLDETQKITQRAQDLTSNLWRDLAVAAAPFVIKILPDTAKISADVVAAAFASVAACFLLFSFFIQIWMNKKYLEQQEKARAAWRQSLALYLTNAQWEQFSESPIQEVACAYKRIRCLVALAYAVLFLILVSFAVLSVLIRTGNIMPPPLVWFAYR